MRAFPEVVQTVLTSDKDMKDGKERLKMAMNGSSSSTSKGNG